MQKISAYICMNCKNLCIHLNGLWAPLTASAWTAGTLAHFCRLLWFSLHSSPQIVKRKHNTETSSSCTSLDRLQEPLQTSARAVGTCAAVCADCHSRTLPTLLYCKAPGNPWASVSKQPGVHSTSTRVQHQLAHTWAAICCGIYCAHTQQLQADAFLEAVQLLQDNLCRRWAQSSLVAVCSCNVELRLLHLLEKVSE